MGTRADCDRPCARKPTTPNIPANSTPSTMCQVTSTRGGSGIAGAVGPEGATRLTKLNWSAQSAKTIKVSSAAAGKAPTAGSERQDMAIVVATSRVKVISAGGACPLGSTTTTDASRYAASEADDIGSILPARRLVRAAGRR